MSSTTAAPAARRRGRLFAFIANDHRYVFLGTSVAALLGLWLANAPHGPMSFLAASYAAESVLYYLLIAWLVVSAVALIFKLTHWKTYRATSPFTAEKNVRFIRYASYVIWAIVAAFVLDRVLLGFAAIAAAAVSSPNNPHDFLGSMIFMVYNGRAVYLHGILTTIALAFFGTIIGFVLALLLVFLRMLEIDRRDNDAVRFVKVVAQGFARFYSTVVRGTPMMIQCLIIYFFGISVLKGAGLTSGQVGIVWSTFNAGLTTISLNSTAYMMEVLRGGIESVDAGQTEAARSLGLSQWQAMTRVVFPQGIKNSIPALSNELVINIKDSSVLSVIGVVDLMFATTTIAGLYFKQLEVYCVTALVYLVLTMVATALLTRLSRRLDVAPRPLLSTSDTPAK